MLVDIKLSQASEPPKSCRKITGPSSSWVSEPEGYSGTWRFVFLMNSQVVLVPGQTLKRTVQIPPQASKCPKSLILNVQFVTVNFRCLINWMEGCWDDWWHMVIECVSVKAFSEENGMPVVGFIGEISSPGANPYCLISYGPKYTRRAEQEVITFLFWSRVSSSCPWVS